MESGLRSPHNQVWAAAREVSRGAGASRPGEGSGDRPFPPPPTLEEGWGIGKVSGRGTWKQQPEKKEKL